MFLSSTPTSGDTPRNEAFEECSGHVIGVERWGVPNALQFGPDNADGSQAEHGSHRRPEDGSSDDRKRLTGLKPRFRDRRFEQLHRVAGWILNDHLLPADSDHYLVA